MYVFRYVFRVGVMYVAPSLCRSLFTVYVCSSLCMSLCFVYSCMCSLGISVCRHALLSLFLSFGMS